MDLHENMRPSMEQIWMNLALDLQKRSTCKRLQVGAVIITGDRKQLVAYGYNGNYSGGPNECDRDEAGNCGCIHAEQNALSKPRTDRLDEMHIMIITDSPCLTCAKLIINSQNIGLVIYKNEYRVKDGLDLLLKSGIGIYKYEK